jgi:hypothetical protein
MSQSLNVVGTTLWELGDIQEVVGLASKITWGQQLVSGSGAKPCLMRLWDVNVKPRGVSRPRRRWVGEGGRPKPCSMRLWDVT